MKNDSVSEEVDPTGGRELDVQIAERLFGWMWLEREGHDGVTRKALFPPEGSDWRRFNFSPKRFRPARADTPRFADWDRCAERFGGQRGDHHYGLPRYSSRIAAAMEVVAKLGGDGYSFACTIYQGHLPYASFCKGTAASSRNAEANTLPEAICRAALALVDGPTQEQQQ